MASGERPAGHSGRTALTLDPKNDHSYKEAEKKHRRPQTASDGMPSKGTGHGAKPAAVREAAIVALLTARTVETAAKQAQVGARTLRRWLAEDDVFKAEYQAARQAAFDVALGRLQPLLGRAIDTLEDLLSQKGHPHVRLAAARTLADLAIHQNDAEAILRRVDDLERSQQQRDGRWR